MNKMTLIYVQGPGNVLAGLSRNAVSAESPPPSGLTEAQKQVIELQQVSDLIGAELWVRSLPERVGAGAPPYDASDREIKVPFENFGLFTDDLDPSVLKDPRAYYFDEKDKKAKALPGMNAAGSYPDIDVSPAGVKLKFNPPVALDTGKIWVLIADTTGQPIGAARQDDIKKNDTEKVVSGPLSPGSYLILALVTGYQPTVFSVQ